MEPESTGEQLVRNEEGKFVPGHPGMGGRPKGSISIKDKVRQHLEEHPEDVAEIVSHFVKQNRELMWQMLEGRPQQDVTSAGEKLPTPIYGGISGHDSDAKDLPPTQAD